MANNCPQNTKCSIIMTFTFIIFGYRQLFFRVSLKFLSIISLKKQEDPN